MDILAHIPDVPVTETWEWLSDILTSYDGTEQRVSLRGGFPRISLDLKLRTTTQDDLIQLWQSLLVGRNLFLIPEYQFATRLTQSSNIGTNRTYYEPSYTDIRVNERILVNGTNYTVSAVHSDGATLTPSLTSAAPLGSIVAPLVEGTLDDGSSINRFAVNEAGDFSVKATLGRQRTTLIRPGNASPLTLWGSVPVLDVIPMASSEVTDTILDDQTVIDNKIALIRLEEKWKEAKLSSPRKYLLERLPITSCSNSMKKDLDYWRHFLQYCRGSQKKFWLPTFRQDVEIVEGSFGGGNSCTVLIKGYGYGSKVYPNQLTHRYLEFVADEATHRAEVYNAVVEGSNMRLFITPCFPPSWPYTIKRVSYLIPSRIDNDLASFEHQGTHSVLSLTFRTAED